MPSFNGYKYLYYFEKINLVSLIFKLCYLVKKSISWFHSSVAQLVEQLTVNQLVAGSSPARGAK